MTTLYASSIRSDDGFHVEIGSAVRHRRGDWHGTVTAITFRMYGASAVRLRVQPSSPEDLDLAMKTCTTWPLARGGTYLEPRDNGLTLSHWEIL